MKNKMQVLLVYVLLCGMAELKWLWEKKNLISYCFLIRHIYDKNDYFSYKFENTTFARIRPLWCVLSIGINMLMWLAWDLEQLIHDVT